MRAIDEPNGDILARLRAARSTLEEPSVISWRRFVTAAAVGCVARRCRPSHVLWCAPAALSGVCIHLRSLLALLRGREAVGKVRLIVAAAVAVVSLGCGGDSSPSSVARQDASALDASAPPAPRPSDPDAGKAPAADAASPADRPEDASSPSAAEAGTSAPTPAADGGAHDAGLKDAGAAQSDASTPADPPALSNEPPATLGDPAALRLPFQLIAADYSSSLDRLVIIATEPNQLIVLDPESGEHHALALPAAPAALSLHPDGHSAAIAHGHAISIVQLDPLQMLDSLPNSLDNGAVTLAANGFVYATDRNEGNPISAIDLKARTETTGGVSLGSPPRVHPQGDRIYLASRGGSPNTLERYDLTDGHIGASHESPYHGAFSNCGDVWFMRDGDRVLTPCGTTFHTSNDPKVDMYYAGSLEAKVGVEHMDDSAAAGLVATVHYDNAPASIGAAA